MNQQPNDDPQQQASMAAFFPTPGGIPAPIHGHQAMLQQGGSWMMLGGAAAGAAATASASVMPLMTMNLPTLPPQAMNIATQPMNTLTPHQFAIPLQLGYFSSPGLYGVGVGGGAAAATPAPAPAGIGVGMGGIAPVDMMNVMGPGVASGSVPPPVTTFNEPGGGTSFGMFQNHPSQNNHIINNNNIINNSNNKNNSIGQMRLQKEKEFKQPLQQQQQQQGQQQGQDNTLQQLEEKRSQNRVHAKKSRERRRNYLEYLEEELNALQQTNIRLRTIVKECIPDQAQTIIQECCFSHPLSYHHQEDIASTTTASAAGGSTTPEPNTSFSSTVHHTNHHVTSTTNGSTIPKGKGKNRPDLAHSDFALIESLTTGRQSFVLTDPSKPDNPIVHASEAFYTLTGYTKEETIGRNCRFLQGPKTDSKAVDQIRAFIEQGRDTSVNLVNYKADGTPFWNQFFIAALHDKDRNIVNYVSRINGCMSLRSPICVLFWDG
jgi:PAS domain S-box-containing protein